MARSAPKTWKLALAVGVPVGLGLGLPAALAGGPVPGLIAFGLGFGLAVGITASVTLTYVIVATRGGARSPHGMLADEHAASVDLGGTREDAWERAREAALALPGARLVSEDPEEGLLEVETKLGRFTQRIRVRLDGTTAAAIGRHHHPPGTLFDLGAAGRQVADLRAALERSRRASTDEIEREAVRAAGRVVEPERS